MSESNQSITDDDKSRPMTDEERSQLIAEVKATGSDINQSDREKIVAKLDADLDAFIAQQVPFPFHATPAPSPTWALWSSSAMPRSLDYCR